MPPIIRLGNDIVDLAQPSCREKYKDNKFVERVFSQAEKNCILNAEDPDKVLWSIWAAKEAGYKACKKNDPTLIFSHKKFASCADTLRRLDGREDFITGTIYYGDIEIPLLFQYPSNDCVHCIGLISNEETEQFDWEKIFTTIKKHQALLSPEQQSIEVRKAAVELLSELGVRNDIIITRSEKMIDGRKYLLPPYLRRDGKLLPDIEISLSHDGQWLAATVYLKNKH